MFFSQNKKKRAAKIIHERKDWYGHADQLIQTNEFINRFRMPKDHFESLLDAIRDAITVDFMRSVQSTKGNDPIYPEVILAMGLRFVGLGSTVPDLANLYSMSISSARCVINMLITALADGGNRNYEFGFLSTLPSPDEADAAATSLDPDA